MKKGIFLVLIIGSVWGVAEIFAKDLMADLGIHRGASIWLAILAVLLLSFARGMLNKPGTSALIGLVATSIRFMGPQTSVCHLLGAAGLGLTFDLFASALFGEGRTQMWRAALVGALTAYGARAFFVLSAIYIAHLERWVDGGASMALEHVFKGGSLVAAVIAVLAPIGFWLGRAAARDLSPEAMKEGETEAPLP